MTENLPVMKLFPGVVKVAEECRISYYSDWHGVKKQVFLYEYWKQMLGLIIYWLFLGFVN